MSVGDLVVSEEPIFQVIVLSVLICSPHTDNRHDQLSVKSHPCASVSGGQEETIARKDQQEEKQRVAFVG